MKSVISDILAIENETYLEKVNATYIGTLRGKNP